MTDQRSPQATSGSSSTTPLIIAGAVGLILGLMLAFGAMALLDDGGTTVEETTGHTTTTQADGATGDGPVPEYGSDEDRATMVEQADTEQHERDGLYNALAALDERSRDIVARRWLNENKETLHELAAEYGVSAERIRQIEAAAMKKLRSSLAA